MAACRRCGAVLPGRRQKCNPDCPVPEAEASSPSAVPAGLHSRGRALWEALDQDAATPLGALALEVCRAADRLDELDRIIAGKGVLQLMRFRLGLPYWDAKGEEHVHVEVGFQSVLGEARQQQATFNKILGDLLAATTAVKAPASAAPASAPVLNPLDQVAAKRAEREQAPG